MIDYDNLRYRSPFTDKAKSSLILQYSEADLILGVEDDAERGKLISAILKSELYGDEPSWMKAKTLGVFYAVASALEVRGGEWKHSCERNKKNTPNPKLDNIST